MKTEDRRQKTQEDCGQKTDDQSQQSQVSGSPPAFLFFYLFEKQNKEIYEKRRDYFQSQSFEPSKKFLCDLWKLIYKLE